MIGSRLSRMADAMRIQGRIIELMRERPDVIMSITTSEPRHGG